ncbi:MAG: hypothetical protein L6276_07440 [Acetobacterium sp.]|nr:hypothetical protein [Acetobacterium sp.]
MLMTKSRCVTSLGFLFTIVDNYDFQIIKPEGFNKRVIMESGFRNRIKVFKQYYL